MSSNIKLTTVYRKFLKHLNTLPSTKPKSPFRDVIIKQFRELACSRNPEEVNRLKSSLSSYVLYTESVKELNYLRYLDTGEKLNPREKISHTARRVGLSVPQYENEHQA